MAGPLTSTFVARSRKGFTTPIRLVRVDFQSPVAQSLYLSDETRETPDGQTWQGLLHSCGVIRHVMRFGPGVAPPAKWSFKVMSQAKAGFQASGSKIIHLFRDFRWRNADVTAFLWDTTLTGEAPAQVYSGVVVDFNVDRGLCEVFCEQDQRWNRPMPSKRITRDQYPRCPEENVGLAPPVVIGAATMPDGVRAPWPPGDPTTTDWLQRAFGGWLGVPAIMVDSGRGGSGQKAKFIISGHALKAINDAANGARFYLNSNGVLIPTIPSGGDVFQGDAGGNSGLLVPDEFDGCYFPVSLGEPKAPVSNPAQDPRYAAAPWDESVWTYFDWDASKRDMEWHLPAIQDPGRAVEYYILVGYQSSATLTNFKVVLKKGATESTPSTLGASTTPTIAYSSAQPITWGSAPLPTTPWSFDECTVRAYWASGTNTGQWVKLFFAAIPVRFGAHFYTERGGGALSRAARQAGFNTPSGSFQSDPPNAPSPIARAVRSAFGSGRGSKPPDTFATEATIAATLLGAYDADGSITGISGTLIQEFPHALAWVLRDYGNEALGTTIETGAAVFGSFPSAWTQYLDIRQRPMAASVMVNQRTDVATVLDWLCRSSLTTIYRSRHDGKWKCIPLKAGSGFDYVVDSAGRTTLMFEELIGAPECNTSDPGDLIGGVNLLYGWDGVTQRFTAQASIGSDTSGAGRKHLAIRHQNLSVTLALNDKMDLDVTGTPYTATFSPGSYQPADLVTEVNSGIAAVLAGVYVALGGIVVAGVNDGFLVHYGIGTNIAVTLTPGDMTEEARAADLQAQLVAAEGPGTWTVTYSRTTKKFTLTRAGGNFEVRAASGAGVFGFTPETHTATNPSVSDFPMEEGMFAFTAGFAFSIKWETGTNGTQAVSPRCAASLLGFDGRVDSTAAKYHRAVCPKGDYERLLAELAAIYGERDPERIELRAVNDGDTVIEAAKRYIDLFAVPRPPIRIRTRACPDLELGRLLNFSGADMDVIEPYPDDMSDGSWEGKKLLVIEVHQVMGPTFEQEVVAVDFTDKIGFTPDTTSGDVIILGESVQPIV